MEYLNLLMACEEHIIGYRSDPCNPIKLNKQFFSAVVVLVFILMVPPVAHTLLLFGVLRLSFFALTYAFI